MSIKINSSPVLYQFTNNQQIVEVSGSTIGQCLSHFVKQFPSVDQWLFDKDGDLHSYVSICINRKSVDPKELAEPVKDGDEISIILEAKCC